MDDAMRAAAARIVPRLDDLATRAATDDSRATATWATEESVWIDDNWSALGAMLPPLSEYPNLVYSLQMDVDGRTDRTASIQALIDSRNDLAALAGLPPKAAAPKPDAFRTVHMAGRGGRIVDFTIPEGCPAILWLSHRHGSSIIVSTLASDGSVNEILVNETGDYAGSVLFGMDDDTHSVALDVKADGTWSAMIKPITEARRWIGEGSLYVAGNEVVWVDGNIEGPTTVTLRHTGDSKFIVYAYTEGGSELVANEIGRYQGQASLPAGTYLITVTADGTWSIHVDE